MVAISKRMANLKSLLSVRVGPGAAVFSPEVSRIHMEFATKIRDGHMGPRKFWRLYLPSLKYHNPAVPMTVTRNTEQEGPATMTVFFRRGLAATTATSSPSSTFSSTPAPASASASTSHSSSTPPPPSSSSSSSSTSEAGAKEIKIEMKHANSSTILSQLLEITNATRIYPTPEEEAEVAALEDRRRLADRDRKAADLRKEREKREKDVLGLARLAS